MGSGDNLRITKRQDEILALASTGLIDKEIADHLSLSVSTVRTHLNRFYRANGLRNRAEAVVAWQRHSEHSSHNSRST